MPGKDQMIQKKREDSTEKPEGYGVSNQIPRLSGTMVTPGPKGDVPQHLFCAPK